MQHWYTSLIFRLMQLALKPEIFNHCILLVSDQKDKKTNPGDGRNHRAAQQSLGSVVRVEFILAEERIEWVLLLGWSHMRNKELLFPEKNCLSLQANEWILKTHKLSTWKPKCGFQLWNIVCVNLVFPECLKTELCLQENGTRDSPPTPWSWNVKRPHPAHLTHLLHLPCPCCLELHTKNLEKYCFNSDSSTLTIPKLQVKPPKIKLWT